MNMTQPVRDLKELELLQMYYRREKPNYRNYLLIVLSLNTALRISDLLGLKWRQVYDFQKKEIRTHLCLTEQKTGKRSRIFLNEKVQHALKEYRNRLAEEKKLPKAEVYLFCRRGQENAPISRTQAFRIIKEAAGCIPEKSVSCHSLRKTFGYHAWQQGVSPALLMNIYNHSSFQVTQRYLGIDQDDRDRVFQKILL